jgi:hypothetical protein
MRVLFYLGHPAHYHLFKHAIKALGSDARVLIKSKDVLERLLQEDGIPYQNITDGQKASGNSSFIKMGIKFGQRMHKMRKVVKEFKPDLLAGSAAEWTVLGRFFNIPSCVFFEDDFEKVAQFAKIAGPLATHLICPDCCSAWKWDSKKIAYNSYHELAYLHPDHFTPNRAIVENIFDLNSKNFILRFSELGAYHDVGKKGISDEIALKLIKMIEPHGKVYITSERPLPPQFEPYRISIRAADIHHALYFAEMFIGDSQTMTAESAVLGTPALRFNDFVGELSYLEDLEHNYGLTYGIKTNDLDKLYQKLDELLNTPHLKQEWEKKRSFMLTKKSNFAKWMINFFQNYPNSIKSKN